MLQYIVCRAVQLGVLQLVLHLLVLLPGLVHGRHRGEGERHGLQDGRPHLVHGGVTRHADRQVGLVEQDRLPDGAAAHHGHLGEGLGHAGGEVGGRHGWRDRVGRAALPRPRRGSDRLGRLGLVDLRWFGGRRWTRAPQLTAVHISTQWPSQALDA